MRRPFTLHGRRIVTSASIGGCMLKGSASPERLIAKADRAMYAVKKLGRNDFRFWTKAGHRVAPSPCEGLRRLP